MATTETVPQPEKPGKVKLQPEVSSETAIAIRVECAKTGETQGEVIDRAIQALLSE